MLYLALHYDTQYTQILKLQYNMAVEIAAITLSQRY